MCIPVVSVGWCLSQSLSTLLSEMGSLINLRLTDVAHRDPPLSVPQHWGWRTRSTPLSFSVGSGIPNSVLAWWELYQLSTHTTQGVKNRPYKIIYE